MPIRSRGPVTSIVDRFRRTGRLAYGTRASARARVARTFQRARWREQGA